MSAFPPLAHRQTIPESSKLPSDDWGRNLQGSDQSSSIRRRGVPAFVNQVLRDRVWARALHRDTLQRLVLLVLLLCSQRGESRGTSETVRVQKRSRRVGVPDGCRRPRNRSAEGVWPRTEQPVGAQRAECGCFHELAPTAGRDVFAQLLG